MNPEVTGASVLFGLTGGLLVLVGYVIWAEERPRLVFAPGIEAPDGAVARRSGQAMILTGIATIGVAIGRLFIDPTAAGWLRLLVPYTLVCLASAMWMRWRLSG